MKLKVLQWNIWYKEDVNNILKTLEKINADIICIQESTVNHPDYNKKIKTAEFLAKKLKMDFYYKASEIDKKDNSSFGNAILSKFKILKTDSKHIQKRIGKANTDYSNENRLFLEVYVKVGSKSLNVGTTHMSYTHKFSETESKNKEADILMSILRKKKENFIFTGDLNALSNSYTIKNISKILKNQYDKKNKPTWTTKPFNYNGFKASKLKYKIDYCYTTKDIKVLKVKTIKTKFSDHLPILLEINF